MTRWFVVLATIALPLWPPAETTAQTDVRFDFEDGGTVGWMETRLAKRSNRFEVVPVDSGSALRATSAESASALLHPVSVALGERAVLQWRWRVDGSLVGNDRERHKDGDDYAARLFVIFDNERLERDTRAICYVWAAHEPIGTSYANPFFPEVATVVLESGDDFAGRWLFEERDIVADYRQLFGDGPMTLRAVALMVDTDNTNSSAVGWFDDITVLAPTATH